MSELHGTERLSAYLDGELGTRERAELEEHLADCADCAAVLEELRRVVTSAGALSDVPPPDRDLWPGIRSRLVPRHSHVGEAVGDRGVLRLSSRRRVVLSVPQLLAAGIAVAVLSTGMAWGMLGAWGSRSGPATAASGASTRAGAGAGGELVLAAYEPAMTELEAEYEARRTLLDPETIRVVERNLAIIDVAIAEAREALAADPSSGFLNTHLADTVRRRMTLLRQVTSL